MLTRKTRSRIVASAAVLAVAAGTPQAYAALDGRPTPSSQAKSATVARGKPYINTRLYFGTGRPDGKPPVSDKQFLTFVDKHVTPKFPSGLTIQRGRGQWRDQDGRIGREGSYELSVLYPVSEARVHDADIEKIRSTYKRIFDQESVLRTDDNERADF
ncbi:MULTISPECIES: DUF3574 domain-containing protein [Streptomyces]|uniref:DUF3574 domain-containing protein n=1 Tax=Streptomyces TaxID=1883 RepID=UPI00034E3D2F|nr:MULTISPECIES: DUF3574 domain-containing protein [Streptomyces]EPD94379.1 hypothetical protein HMPREF1486_02931 [Streptomyces sp. HPH0547]KPC63629.1 choline dehydrogenase [Streptomyces sp. NRRL F-6602]UVN54782.1 DUF3574 domain-containing protein [Streptomyces albus]